MMTKSFKKFEFGLVAGRCRVPGVQPVENLDACCP